MFCVLCWQPVDAEQCFAKLPSTDVALQTAVYYYSMQLVPLLVCCTDDKDTSLSSIYRTSPASLSTAVVTYISRVLSDPVVSTQMSASVHQMALRLMHYNGRLIELTQAQALRRLDTGESPFTVNLHLLTYLVIVHTSSPCWFINTAYFDIL